MGDCRVDGKDSPPVSSPEEMAGRFQAELMTALPGWKQQLLDNPEQLPELERRVHATFCRGADLVMVGLLSLAMKDKAFDQACEETRQGFAYPLERGRMRQIRVRLLGGLLIWVTSLYCAARSSAKKESRPGLYVELAQFGFGKGCSPELQYKVARLAALCPSLQFAQQELEREGVKLDVKTVRRIAMQLGEGLLWLRALELQLWREGNLPAGDELAGKRVSVQLDGGRTRIRDGLREAPIVAEATDEDGLVVENSPGCSRKRAVKTFDGEWREPKLLTIYVHDEHGRMEKQSQAYMDGTLQGPDAVAELIAMHLHRMGAARAASITFVADGGVWIWDRIPTIARLAKLDSVSIHHVLDCYHASHHISLALAAMGLNDKERMPLYRQHRTLLRNGQWRRVVDELSEIAAGDPEESDVWREIEYLRKHGEAGRLKYPTFRGLGLPLGSGSIESGIRRVINMRLKGNSIFWREEGAEAIMQIRAWCCPIDWTNGLPSYANFARPTPAPIGRGCPRT
jgi:hypothetical protein